MPTYDYECQGCGHVFEEFQSITEEPLKKCPACKKKKLRRLISGGAAILFKGSGFYQTDYRSESYKSEAKKEAEQSGAATNGKAGDNNTGSKSEPKKSESAGKSSKSET
jgi:putative FmdB family regulatory protein